MRILLINKYHYLRGGAERAYFDMAQLLREAGHEVAFFSMKHPDNELTEWEEYFVENVELGGPDRKGVFYRFRAVFRIFWYKGAQMNLERLIRDFRPDIAHLHNIYHQISPSVIWTLKKHHIPMVMTVHDYKLICPNYSLFVRGHIWERNKNESVWSCVVDRCVKDSFIKSLICTLEAIIHRAIGTYSKIDVFVAPSKFIIEKFHEFGFTGDMRHVAQPVIASSKKCSSDQDEKDLVCDNQGGDCVAPFLFFGRLSIEKGVDVAIRAMARYEGKSFLHIVGSGPDEQRLREIAHEFGVANRVLFLGSKFGEKLTKEIRGAKAIVIPSVWYENMPYVLNESLSLGKIVLASKIGGITERIDDGKEGFLFDCGNVDSLAQGMNCIDNLSMEDRRRISVEAIRKYALFSQKEAYVRALESIYAELLNENVS